MAHDMLRLEPLDPRDAQILAALLVATSESQSCIEAKVFRRDHREHRKEINRLEQVGYLRKERVGHTECYVASLTAMVQMRDHPLVASILHTAELIWRAFRAHYEASLDAPLTLKSISELIGEPIEDVTRVHAYMREWWHTPICFTPVDALYQSVTVREEVLDHDSFDDCIHELIRAQLLRLETAQHSMAPLAQLDGFAAPSSCTPPALREPSWFGKLPQHAQALMREIHVAQHFELLALSTMGVRAVIDVAADHILGKAISGFDTKLRSLRDQGHLTSREFDVIKAVVEMGHAAAHRAHVPDKNDVRLMLEALDHMLCSAYGLHDAQQALVAKTPPRANEAKLNKAI